MTRDIIRIGTRGSELALIQSHGVMKRLKRKFPAIRFEIVVIKTMGDKNKSLLVFDTKSIGLFTKELEKHLKKGTIDLAVHSLKDLPTTLQKGLVIAATAKRESARDVLVSRRGWTLNRLPEGSTVGTSSIRRSRQMVIECPDIEIVPLRGNIDTRVKRALKGEMDAIVIAEAGLRRLGRFRRYAKPLPPQIFIPSPGQGILAVEARSRDAFARRITGAANDADAALEALAERECLRMLHGGCRVPAGIHARSADGRILIRAAVYSVHHIESLSVQMTGARTRASAVKLGREAARVLLRQGAGDYLREARRHA